MNVPGLIMFGVRGILGVSDGQRPDVDTIVLCIMIMEITSKPLAAIIRKDDGASYDFTESTGEDGLIDDMYLTDLHGMVHFKSARDMNKLAMHRLDI